MFQCTIHRMRNAAKLMVITY